jgi:uncharacterized repeat protein (TIGR01451 family)
MVEQNKLLVNKLLVAFLLLLVSKVSLAKSTTDLALGKAVTSSSVNANNYAYYATDGSTTTRWESASSDPHYIYVDLGAQYDLCRVALTWEAAYGKNFTIDISSNGSTWTTAATLAGNYIKNNSIAISGQGRYVRMSGTARGTTYGYSLYDFAVYAMLPAISVKKRTDAAELGTGGTFRFSLPTGITYTEDITVNYTVTGTATAGTDYTSLPDSVVIPAGTNYVDVNYNTNDDKIIEGNETVIVTLTSATAGSSDSYLTFPLSATDYSATGTISDDDNTATYMVLNLAATTGAGEPATNGAFTLSLPTGYTAKEDLTLTYTVSGSATPGDDYTALSGTVIIPAGTNSMTLPVNVIDNYKADGTRTVILTLVSGTDGTHTFQPGTDNTATVSITDNDVANYQAWKVATLPSTNPDGKIQPGQVITYTIYVRNTSNTVIGPLTITDKIPTNTNWESGGSLAAGVVGFSIPSLAAGAVTQVSFQVKTYENLDGVPSINNTAHVSDGFNKIPTYACHPQTATCDTVTKVIVRPTKGDLTITKTVAAPGPYVIEDYITYNIVVKNVGYSSFTNLVIVDSLPYNLDLPYHTTTSKGATAFSVSPRKVTWYVNELVPGDSVFITVTCRILTGDHVINTAYVWANEGEADYTNNTDINKEETSNKDLYFINAFRPGAAQNDKFVIVGIEKYPGSHLLVYSRWGNVVYESKSYNNDWTADNIPMGEYIYKVVVPKKTGKFTYSGTVVIIK